jgi:hypothetical protein
VQQIQLNCHFKVCDENPVWSSSGKYGAGKSGRDDLDEIFAMEFKGQPDSYNPIIHKNPDEVKKVSYIMQSSIKIPMK